MTHDPAGTGATDEERADERRPSRRWVGLAAALLLAIGLVIPFLTAATADSGSSTTTPPTSPGASVSLGPSVPTMQIGLPVYFVSTQNHLFYRELRNLPSQGGPMSTAVSAVLNVVPNDPQYESLWKGGTVNSVTVRSNRIYVDLSASSYAAFTDKVTAIDAAYQIYYTVNAVRSSLRQPLPVVLLSDGKQPVPVLGDTGTKGFWSDPPSLGPAWIDSPQSAQIVPPGEVRFSGYILSGNPAPTLQVTQASSGNPVSSGTVQLGRDDGQWQEWSYVATLSAGDYQATVQALDTTDTVVFKVGS